MIQQAAWQADARHLGWLGTSRMGTAMVRRLLARGCPVTVYNRTASNAAPLVEPGARAVGSIPDLARIVKLYRDLFLGVVGSQFTGYKTPTYVNLDFEPTFTSRLLRKDFDPGLAAAREKEVATPVSATVRHLIQSLAGHGYGDVDFAAFMRQEAESAGITLESEHAEVSGGLEPEDF
jgi:3-hydroxyisobutyrate dehydrogenase-like beta-hydroxyacid dehydrogenase